MTAVLGGRDLRGIPVQHLLEPDIDRVRSPCAQGEVRRLGGCMIMIFSTYLDGR